MSSPIAPKHLYSIILLLLVAVLPFCTAQNTYYVKPTPDTPCHEDPCHTLSEYVSEIEHYLTSNTTIIFLPGEHILQRNVTVSNVDRLAFRSNSSTSPADVKKIICTNTTLTFTNICTLEVAGLGFHSCILEFDTSSAVFKNSSFENSTSAYGGAIYAHSSTITFDGQTRFAGNRATVFGGGIFAEESNLTFHGYTIFINNDAMEGGGGIYMVQSDLKFAGNASFKSRESNSSHIRGGGMHGYYSCLDFDCTNTFIFLDNSAVNGGGLLVKYSTVSFSGTSQFINNSAVRHGGGVYVWDSTVRFSDDSGFIDNSAWLGGGVYVVDSTVMFGDDSRFTGNLAALKGGGMVLLESNVSFGDDSRFNNNFAWLRGGGLYVEDSTVRFGDDSGFIDNSAVEGGGVYVEESTVSYGDDCSFTYNSATQDLGGGVCAEFSTVSFGDDCSFTYNSAMQYLGGGVYAEFSILSFGDDSRFNNNFALMRGGGLYVEDSTVRFGDDSRFINNSAPAGGGVFVLDSTARFGDDCRFIGNSGINGGAVLVRESNVRFDDNSEFINNSAYWGGGIAVLDGSNVGFGDDSGFIGNSANFGGGVDVKESNVSFGDDSKFINNTGGGGGGVHVWHSIVSFADSDFAGNLARSVGGCMAAMFSTITNVGSRSHFTNNSARYGGCIFVDTCNLTFSKTTILSGNSAITSNSGGSSDVNNAWYGGAILASKSDLTFGGTHVLKNNSAGYGGAVYLSLDSKIHLLPNTTIYFESNLAEYRGGALFVEDNPFTYCIIDSTAQLHLLDVYHCFIQVHNIYEAGCTQSVNKDNLDQSIELRFQDDVANEAGSVLYGGNLALCGVCTSHDSYVSGKVAFNTWANTSSDLMSSDPYHVCICVDNHPDCSQGNATREMYPGVTVAVPVVTFGQYDGSVPTVIQTYTSEGITLGSLQYTQWSNNTCTNLEYTVRSRRDINIWSEATLTLYADEPCSTLGLPLEVFLTFLPCPLGFSLSAEGSCVCDSRLNKYEVECDINDQSILRKESVWIGFEEQSDNQSQGLILHPHCPFDYCKPETDSVNFTMNATDLQCSYNRSGYLCGACQHGFSLAVGSSRCLPCSNMSLALLIPFVFAGLALVVFLFICKVTVAAGTISGLIFYANIVTVNHSIFFPSGETNVLTVFIAWLNLDLGIETCFFDGMDAYSMVWLQFVFPIYIWLLVGLITILCNFSTTAARIIGSTNPIAVLATLFLLSYTKLLRTTIAIFSFTILEYPYNETKAVWLYDGNIGYLDRNDGRHIAVFLASLLVVLFLFLPYMTFLLLGQCILPRLNLNKLRWLSWANYLRMKSFLDAHHAPYKDKHRYWIGLLLVFRFIMFLISAVVDIESPQDPHVNLLVITISTSMLGMWVWSGVYKKWYLTVLESSFILNLAILAVATYQVKLAGGNQAAVFYSSVSVAFSTFIGIITYHVYQCMRDSRAWRNLVRKRNERRRARGQNWQREDAASDEEMEEMLPQVAPTVTYVDIPTDERREMRPITPPLSPTHLPNAHEPLDHSQREDAATGEEMEEMLPQVAPVAYIPAVKAMCPLIPPQPRAQINFTDVREPLDLLTQ